MRPHLALLAGLALAASAFSAAAQDGGAFYNEQVRRNQQLGIPGQPTAVAPPTIRGPGALYHDTVRQRQEGNLGPRIPTRPTPSRQILTPDQRVATPSAPIPPITSSSGRRIVGGRPVQIRRGVRPRPVQIRRSVRPRPAQMRRAVRPPVVYRYARPRRG